MQASGREEHNFSNSSFGEQNIFFVKLYSIMEDTVKIYTRTRIQDESKALVYVSKEALHSYIENQYGGKFGKGNI